MWLCIANVGNILKPPENLVAKSNIRLWGIASFLAARPRILLINELNKIVTITAP